MQQRTIVPKRGETKKVGNALTTAFRLEAPCRPAEERMHAEPGHDTESMKGGLKFRNARMAGICGKESEMRRLYKKVSGTHTGIYSRLH